MPVPRTDTPTSRMGRIRAFYGVPARRGARISFGGRKATITSTTSGNMHIRARFDDDQKTRILHPTWNIDYLTEETP